MLLGALAGGQKDVSEQTTRRQLDPASAQETAAGATAYDSLSQLQGLIGLGPGSSDVTNSLDAQRQLATMLQGYSQNGGMPNAAQTQIANAYGQQSFQSQQDQNARMFDQQRQQASMLANRQGRNVDIVTTNKINQEQQRQQQQLASNQGSFSAQYAQQLPGQQIDYQQQYAQVQAGLSQQAMANRQALIGLGSQLRNSDRDFRNSTAAVQQTQQSGGGFKGAVTGALAETGAIFGAAGGFSGS